MQKRIKELGRPRRPLPKGVAFAAFGDIHGNYELLLHLEEEVDSLLNQDAVVDSPEDVQLVYLGDYIDRGPHSLKVVEHLQQAHPDGYRVICLCGNHEWMMQHVVDHDDQRVSFDSWTFNGGMTTIAEVMPAGLDRRADDFVDLFAKKWGKQNLDWVRGLPYTHRIGDYFFVHAGIDPDLPLRRQVSFDQLWIRDAFLEHGGAYPEDVFVVHGHTPVGNDADMDKKHRFNCDSGAYISGTLSALVCLETKSYGPMTYLLQVTDPAVAAAWRSRRVY